MEGQLATIKNCVTMLLFHTLNDEHGNAQCQELIYTLSTPYMVVNILCKLFPYWSLLKPW